MSGLSASTMLQAWECTRGALPLRRSLALLQAAWPDVEYRHWQAMPVGARDDHLLALHEAMFGAGLDTLAECPACGEAMQAAFAAADLRPAPAFTVDDDAAAGGGTLACDGYELQWRLPNSGDLLALVESGARAESAVADLVERCVLAARHGEAVVSAADLPAIVVDRLQEAMAERDPGSDTRIAITCTACGHVFTSRFDIAAYLCDEMDDWAERTLAQVHVLAGAYGWSEPEILALSPWRRDRYLEMVQA